MAQKIAGPDAEFREMGVLEDGIDVSQFAHIRDVPYMMDLDNCRLKPDGQMEQEAVARFKPIYNLFSIDDEPFNASSAAKCFKGLVSRAEINRKKNVGKEETHISMRKEDSIYGGKYHIPVENTKYPLENEEWFLKLYAMYYLAGKFMWFIEKKTPVYRFFMDLDFKQPESLSSKKVEAVAFVVSRSVKKFFPSVSPDSAFFRIIACTTSHKTEQCNSCVCLCVSMGTPDSGCKECHGLGCTGKNMRTEKPCEKCEGNYPVKKKTGVHLIWPEIFLSDTECRDIRETVIADLIQTFGHRVSPFNDWTDVVDLSVYKGSGLRMLGSRKAADCKVCNKKGKVDNEPCSKCNGLGRIDEGRPYAPLFCTDGSGRRHKNREASYEENYHRLLLDCKIRSANTEISELYVLPAEAPRHETADKSGGRARTPKRQQRITADTQEAQVLQTFFKTCPQVKYQNLVVTSVLRQGKKYVVNVTGENCTYCQNVGRCHKSNRIYFTVSHEGIMQHCHDNADKLESDMKYGLCKDYVSAPMALQERVLRLLFNESTETSTVITEGISRGISDVKIHEFFYTANFFCKQLYGTDWTTSARFASFSGEKLIQVHSSAKMELERSTWLASTYKKFCPDALGLKNDEEVDVLRELGFYEEVVQDKAEPQNEQEKLMRTPSIKDLQRTIFQTLRNVIGHCLNADEKEIIAKLKSKANFASLKAKKKKALPRLPEPVMQIEKA